MTPTPRAGAVVVALACTWLFWGATFLGIRVVVRYAPPLLSAGVRFVVAGAILLAIVGVRSLLGRGEPLLPSLRGRVGWLSALGLAYFLGANGLVSIASQDLPSSTAGLLYSTVPVWTLLVAAVARRSAPSVKDLAFTAVGLVGVAVLLGAQSASLLPSVLVLLAAVLWGVASIFGARDTRPDAPPLGVVAASGVQMLAGGLGLLVVSGFTGDWGALTPDLPAAAWLAEVYLILCGSIGGFLAYTWLVTSGVDPRLTSTFAYVNPVVAVLLGALVLAEPIGIDSVIGAALVAVAVARTVVAAGKARRDEPLKQAPGHPRPTTVAARSTP